MYLWCSLAWSFFQFGVLSVSWTCRFKSFAKFGKSSAIISWHIFSAPPFSLLRSWRHELQIFACSPSRVYDTMPFIFFLEVYFLLFRLGSFYCSIFRCIDSFFCPLHFTFELIQWGLLLCLLYFSALKFQFHSFFFLIFHFFVEIFFFSPPPSHFGSRFVIDHWETFLVAQKNTDPTPIINCPNIKFVHKYS